MSLASEFDPPYGYAIRRNGTCPSSETACYATWGDFWACCPGEAHCPGNDSYIPNNVCCPGKADCTEQLVQTPHCANSTWKMHEHNGYFCCEEGQYGFWTSYPPDNYGCSDEYPDHSNFTILTAEPQGFGTSITSTASATMSTSTASETSETSVVPASDENSSVDTGAIAGGVVGGVVAVALIIGAIWFFLRRQRSSKATIHPGPFHQPHSDKEARESESATDTSYYNGSHMGELEARSRPPELDGSRVRPTPELPS